MARRYSAIFMASVSEQQYGYAMLMDLSISHPCFIQLCGIAKTPTMHAAVFHDGATQHLQAIAVTEVWSELDLIPFLHFVELHRHSPILVVYIYRYCVH
jgi:hypothetical protein